VTEPTEHETERKIDAQETAFEALTAMSRAFGHLPRPHVTVSESIPNQVDLMLSESFGAFEAWREALRIPPSAVGLHGVTRKWLVAAGAFNGASVMLQGPGFDVPARQARPAVMPLSVRGAESAAVVGAVEAAAAVTA
jgi:hypothetical protein